MLSSFDIFNGKIYHSNPTHCCSYWMIPKNKKNFCVHHWLGQVVFSSFYTCTILHLPLFEKSRISFQNFNEMHHQTMKLYIFLHKRSLNQYMMWIRSTQQPTQSAQTAVCSILHHLAWIWNFIKLVGWIQLSCILLLVEKIIILVVSSN